MKTRHFFAWLMIVYCLAAQAQMEQMEYRPFAQDGKTWESQVGLIMENVYGNRFDGDTIIGGENWKKVYNYYGMPEFNYSYYAAIRDVGNKVYAIAKGSNRPRLLYDFSLKEGYLVKCGKEGNAFGCLLDKDEQPDTLLGFQFVAYLRVERIDTIKARGMQHRRFTLTLLDAFKEPFRGEEQVMIGNVVWVEGVGSGAGPFSPWMPLPPKDSFLQSCYIYKTCLFGYPDFYENDETNAVGSTPFMGNGSSIIYNLQGIQMMGKPKKGVYIQNGRKYVK